ncbi:methionine adenosyltransferase [Pseudomonas sp. SK3(2021)]|uniref:methionine adenosyltransferase n=1 Tax=Pseudomonas sp. SK3(2021) TaxID=2841064 RepID=UPI00192C101D|nr:methionine adenosyltransferase [Pseudomonas sp. SK3(2021)]QQZ39464.1 methionine adenosyltransferase [Pseudomonas sp. SK3(2021)]
MNDMDLVITKHEPFHARAFEICEHKGIGHPDSLCDGVAEAVSLALNRAYLHAFGRILHYNVDKALLIGGESLPRFGGGQVLTPMRLIIGGRASPLPDTGLPKLVRDAAYRYLCQHLRCDPALFDIECAVRTGSPNLQQAFVRGVSRALANDTSFGVGFAPYSPLEKQVLQLGTLLRSTAFQARFPATGDDYKVMAARVGARRVFTVALALIDREIPDAAAYFAVKDAMREHLLATLASAGDLAINTLDDAHASGVEGIYLTVSGLSAEQGDDGEVGRGNRMNGLITPCRSMSLEAVAGKNPVSHVGKLYNALAWETARAVITEIEGVEEATVQLLSRIGQPVERPALVAIELACHGRLTSAMRQAIEVLVHARLSDIECTSSRLVQGELPAF